MVIRSAAGVIWHEHCSASTVAPVCGTGYSCSCAGISGQLHPSFECSAGTGVSVLQVQSSSRCVGLAVLCIKVGHGHCEEFSSAFGSLWVWRPLNKSLPKVSRLLCLFKSWLCWKCGEEQRRMNLAALHSWPWPPMSDKAHPPGKCKCNCPWVLWVPGIAALPGAGTDIQAIINTRSYLYPGLTLRVAGVIENCGGWEFIPFLL